MFCCSRVRALPRTVVNLAKAVLPGMLSRGEGQFAAVSSMAACVPFVGYAAYAPAKVLSSLTLSPSRSLALSPRARQGSKPQPQPKPEPERLSRWRAARSWTCC